MEPIQVGPTTRKLTGLVVYFVALAFCFGFVYLLSGHLVTPVIVTAVWASCIPLGYIVKKMPWAKEYTVENIQMGLFRLCGFVALYLIFPVSYWVNAGFSLADFLSPLFLGFLLGLFVVIAIAIIYARVYPEIFNPMTDEQLREPYEQEVILPLDYGRAFELSKRSVQILPHSELKEENRKTGIIYADAATLFGGYERITFTVEKISIGTTRVKIHSIDRFIKDRSHPGLTGQNERFVKTLASFLTEQSHETAEISPVQELSGPAPERSSVREIPDPSGAIAGKNPFTRDPVHAGMLSLVIPGLGQGYNGRSELGLAIAFGTGFGLLFYMVPGILVWTFGVYNAYTSAQKINQGIIPYKPIMVHWMFVIVAVALVSFAVAYLFISFFGPAGALGFDSAIICRKMQMECI